MRSFIIIAILAAGAAACGKNAPTSPSNSAPAATTPGASAGATISGTVQSDASTLATHSGASLTGVTVTVVGTAISTNVDGAGHFSLSSVPAGDVQLRFTGAADATLPVGAVEATETVDLVINVSGSSASIESEVRNGAAEAQLEGKIEALPPTTAALTFKAVGRTVKTDSSTQFVDGGATRSFADLALGMRVHVKGTFANDVMTARWIELQSPQLTPPTTPTPPEDTSASIHGTLKSMSGTKPALTLTVDTTTVHTFASTDVKRRGDSRPSTRCSSDKRCT